MTYVHEPVLLNEVIHYLDPKPGQHFIDCTLGGGGHTAALCRRTAPNGSVLSIDLDPLALTAAQSRLGRLADHVIALAARLGFSTMDVATGGASGANTTSGMGVPSIDGLGPIGGRENYGLKAPGRASTRLAPSRAASMIELTHRSFFVLISA